MADRAIPPEYMGWWRIVETSQWADDDLDICGPALISLTGRGDRLRLFVLLALVDCTPTRTGVSFTWEGAWAFDPRTGAGSVRIDKDGRLKGKLKIARGPATTFVAERTEKPHEPIDDPPNPRHKWSRR